MSGNAVHDYKNNRLTCVDVLSILSDMERFTEGCRRLRSWMERSRLNQVAAAEVIGVSYALFNKLYLGVRLPGRDTAVQIEHRTGIPVDAWVSRRLDNSTRPVVTRGANR